MMKARILVCDPIDKKGIRRLKEAGLEVDVRPAISAEELKRIVSDYDALIVRSRTKVTKEIIERGSRLKVIGRPGTGLDNIDVKSAEEKRITVLNTPEATATAVAELTIGLILSLSRNIPLADRSMKKGKWIKKDLRGWHLKGKTVGLIGLGNVGLRVAQTAKCLGMRILVTKRTPPSQEVLERLGAKFMPLDDLLRESDIVSLHLPLSEETYRMIGSRELNLMKDRAYLINTSRGAIIDDEALFEALQSGKLGGAGLDVYEFEPPTDLRLVMLPNVVCTPHVGAQTEEAQREASVMMADKIINLLSAQ